MGAHSIYLKEQIINHVLRDTPFTGPTTVYIALFNSDAGLKENLPTGEVDNTSGEDYERLAVSFSGPVNGASENDVSITFNVAGAPWGTVTHLAIVDHETNVDWGGDVNVLYYAKLYQPMVIDTGDYAFFDTGTILINQEELEGTFAFGYDGGTGLVHSKYNGLLEVTSLDFDYISCNSPWAAGIKDGELYTWGTDVGNGNLGQGSNYFGNGTPTKIGTDTDWVMVSCGESHGAAIKSDGTLWTWGGNGSYQLGHGDQTNRNTPTQVGSDTDWEYVSCGNNFTMAIKDGDLFAVGFNGNYRTALNTNSGNTTTWTLANSGGWTSVSVLYRNGLGIKNGELWSWGENLYGQTGQGTTSGSTQVPTQVGSAADWVQISAGAEHSAAINSSGELFTFGGGQRGRLGQGNTTTINVPTQVGSGTDWSKVKCTSGVWYWGDVPFELTNTYALKTDGTLWATGLNTFGQCGQPNSEYITTFAQVGDSTNHILIAAGSGNCITVRRNLP
jgi:hypothetical protein